MAIIPPYIVMGAVAPGELESAFKTHIKILGPSPKSNFTLGSIPKLGFHSQIYMGNKE